MQSVLAQGSPPECAGSAREPSVTRVVPYDRMPPDLQQALRDSRMGSQKRRQLGRLRTRLEALLELLMGLSITATREFLR